MVYNVKEIIKSTYYKSMIIKHYDDIRLMFRVIVGLVDGG
jgi:hypothetical protein